MFADTSAELAIALGIGMIGIFFVVLLGFNRKSAIEYERLKAQKALIEAELKYRTLVEESLVGIYIIQDGRFVYVNPQLIQMSGYSHEELVGAEVSHFIFPEDLPLVLENMGRQLIEGFSGVRFQYRAIKKDQSLIYIEVLGSKTLFNGRPAITGSVIDITQQKRAEEQIQQMVYHDLLTGLPNRYQFLSYFQSAILKQNIQSAAILFLDLDRFKVINDTLGHDLGDLLLKEVAERLKNGIHTKECLARHGEDKFILFLPDFDQESAFQRAKEILDRINRPFLFNDYEMYVSSSIGISLYPQDGKDIETLIKKANLALHQAKRLGNNDVQFYLNQSLELTHELFDMEKDLHKALEREELVLYYQPKMNIHSGEMVGLEALIRWQHPDKGLISPAKFIPLAEETGLIVPIGEWVLRQACAQNMVWQKNAFSPMMISVNLSVRQFFQPNLIQIVKEILHDTGLSPEYLELEITESMMMDTHHALVIVKELKKLGVKISLDDFGKGYSSLYYLKEFPIDKLKIDQSFIRDCFVDENDGTIVKTIIAMAHQLKLEVIAEGVETKDQLIFLQQNLCNEAQGYLFSKPLPVAELEQKYREIEQLVNQLGVPQEIRDQKRMEEALRVAQQDLKDTLRHQQGMTLKFKEQDGRLVHTLCDGELIYRMGLVPEQVIGRDLHEILPTEMAKEKLKYYQKAWNGEQHVTYEDEYNGIYYFASLRPVRRGGRVVEVIASCVDITERKKAEELLRKSDRLLAVAELAAGVAHEIRNPLTSIKGFAQLLKQGISQPEYTDIMLTEVQRLDSIIHQFLILAKPQMVQCKQANLVDLLKCVINLNETLAINQNIQIKYEFETEILFIWCDENQLKQVFINLLMNAIESMPDGGEIVLQVKRIDAHCVTIRLIDQGCGIPEARIQKLGEPFYSTKEKGTGLGLMVSFRIVKEHKGMIHFESEVNKGTTVEVILPVSSEGIGNTV